MDERAMVVLGLLSRSRSSPKGTKGPDGSTSESFPHSHLSFSSPDLPVPSHSVVRSVFFVASFLRFFFLRCRPMSPVNVPSHVLSEGFCESADDCRRVIRRFLA